MWRERFAISTAKGEELTLVLIEEAADSTDDKIGCDLMVYRHHLSANRECVFSRDFAGLDAAQEFCAREYDVQIADWQDPITQTYRFEFDYQVSNIGVAQPFPLGFAGRRVVFRLSERSADDVRGRKPVLDICGSREGLRWLAALCLLSADSAKYDEWFHIHLENQEGLDSNIDATIRAPNYLEGISSRKFQEYKGDNIPLRSVNDGSPSAEK